MGEDTTGSDRMAFLAAVTLATVGGAVLRALHLDIPLRYDEAVTYLDYASRSFTHAATAYPTPNNHLLNTVLIHGLTSVLGGAAWVIRLPAFAAGCLLVPAVAWFAAPRFGPRTAAVAAFLTAATPVLVEYSTNARGYSIVALTAVAGAAVAGRILRGGSEWWWPVLAVLAVAGLYTVPVALLPWAGISVWMWMNLFLDEPSWRVRLARVAPLVAVAFTVTVVVVSLYLPVVRHNGLDALTANRFVAPQSWLLFLSSLPASAIFVIDHWTRALPGPLLLLFTASVVAALALRPRQDRNRVPFPLGWSFAIATCLILLVGRNAGEPRIWLWALPFVLTAAAAGLVAAVERLLRPTLSGWVVPTVTGVWAVLVPAHLLIDRPLWRSLETGGFPEAVEVANWLGQRVAESDGIVTDFVSWEPLRYYLRRQGIDDEELMVVRDGTLWVVLNGSERRRVVRARNSAAELGVNLSRAEPIASIGRVDIYGFRRGDRGG